MPVKIVAGPSNPQKAQINQLDLHRIIGDFENFAEINSNITRPFNKINFVTIPKIVLKALLEDKEADKEKYDHLSIHFAITLPDQKSCSDNFQTDISNQLSVVINNAKFDGNVLIEKKNIGDSVIAIGFRSDVPADTPPCCGKPGGGGPLI